MDETSAVAQMNFLSSIASKNSKKSKQLNQNTILTEFFNRLLGKEKKETSDRSDHYETFAYVGVNGLQEIDCKVNDLLQNKQQRLLARTRDISKPSTRVVKAPFSKPAPEARKRDVVPNAPEIIKDQPSPRISTVLEGALGKGKHLHTFCEGRSSTPNRLLDVDRTLFARKYGSTVEKVSNGNDQQKDLDMLYQHIQQDAELQKLLPKLKRLEQKENKSGKRKESIKMPTIPPPPPIHVGDEVPSQSSTEDVLNDRESIAKETKKGLNVRKQSVFSSRKGSIIRRNSNFNVLSGEPNDIDDNLDAHIPIPFTPLTNHGNIYRFKKNKKKNIKVVYQEENDSSVQERLEAEKIIIRLKELNSSIPSDVVRKAICHPIDLQKPQLEIPKKVEPEESIAKKGKPIRSVDHLKDHNRYLKPELFKRSKITKLLHLNTIVAERKEEKQHIIERFNIHIHNNKHKQKNNSNLSIKARTSSWWTRQEYKAIDENILRYRYEKQEKQKAKAESKRPFRNKVSENLDYTEIAYTSSKFKRNPDNDANSTAQNHWFESSRPSSRAYSDSQSSMFMNGQAWKEMTVKPRTPSNAGYFEYSIRHRRSQSDRSIPFYVSSTKYRDDDYI
ncbi:hypothetical protein HK103_003657 [Boothiomyces macroporosus]|uniref:Uncharacterized protein n=1 Tax=Boothiomyces macroporosus TaxID=261099 RepID=A0AAD5UIC6_9FUNG|nr:hypothetical protein HK103_003657 [Boothiomyces macroporosus]